jgi:hypothetical protein
MTDFVLTRVQRDPDVTIGELKIGVKHVCWVLEDPVREVEGKEVEKWKVKGDTAIPYGRYRIEMTFSPRFQMSTPELRDVPGFSGIRIHTGNDARDTEGCLLPGLERRFKSVGSSRLALIEWRKWLDAIWRNGDEAWIEIVKGEEDVV